MALDEVRNLVSTYIDDVKNRQLYNKICEYLDSIEGKQKEIESETLLDFARDKLISKRYSKRDACRSGSPGVVVLELHHAYPLLLTLLGYWVNAVWKNGWKENLSAERKRVLYDCLRQGIDYWDFRGLDRDRYDYLLDRLLPTKSNDLPTKKWDIGSMIKIIVSKIPFLKLP